MHIRLWAPTDQSPSAVLALEYARALVRYAPVRLITTTGKLLGAWADMKRLLETPMPAPLLNVVCCDEENWVRSIKVGMPEEDRMHASIATGKVDTGKVKTEEFDRELYTVGVRNVLIASKLPSALVFARTAAKYESIVVPTHELQLAWTSNQALLLSGEPRDSDGWRRFASGPIPTCIKVPVTELREFRVAVTGQN